MFDDPVTGQALGIVSSAAQPALLVNDGLDNPVGLLTSGAGNSFVYTYDPWGVQTLVSSSGQGASQNPYAFHGGIKDPGSGLIKFGLRWYNPVTGTWTQQDTLDAPLDPANANRYAYVGDDPINNLDPNGEFSGTEILKETAIQGSAGLVGGCVVGGITALLTGPRAALGCAVGAAAGGIGGLVTGAITSTLEQL